jgi:hypothetical protein
MNDKRSTLARDAKVSDLFSAMIGDTPAASDQHQQDKAGVVMNDDGTLTAGAYTITAVGIRPTDRPASESDWAQLGAALRTLHKSLAWVAGDWLVLGEHTFGKDVKELASTLDVDEGTIHNWTWVARSVEFSRRREKLSYSHHVEVAKFDDPADQNYWLDMAEKLRYTAKELRAQIKDQPLKLAAAPLLDEDAIAALDVIRKLTSDRLNRMTKPAQLRGLINQAEAARNAADAMVRMLADRLAEVERR